MKRLLSTFKLFWFAVRFHLASGRMQATIASLHQRDKDERYHELRKDVDELLEISRSMQQAKMAGENYEQWHAGESWKRGDPPIMDELL